MSIADIVRATKIPEPFVWGIQATESNGNPHALRFEPHLFLRYQGHAVRILSSTPGAAFVTDDEERHAVFDAGLIPYTHGATRAASDSKLETGREAFDHAMHIDPSDALRSASLGRYQDLGACLVEAALPTLGHHLLNFSDADAVRTVKAFDADADGLSDPMLIAWLHANPKALDAAIHWRVDEFITRYNGAQDTHRYRLRFDPAALAHGAPPHLLAA